MADTLSIQERLNSTGASNLFVDKTLSAIVERPGLGQYWLDLQIDGPKQVISRAVCGGLVTGWNLFKSKIPHG